MTRDNHVRQLRNRLGLTQGELGKRVGLYQQKIQRIETGIEPLVSDAAALCIVLGEPLHRVFPYVKNVCATCHKDVSRG